jgi:hypothetical protein
MGEIKLNLIHSGEFEGRTAELYVYSSGELKVVTKQKITEITEFCVEGGEFLLPSIIEEGNDIDIDADTIRDLEIDLHNIAYFSVEAAREIASIFEK